MTEGNNGLFENYDDAISWITGLMSMGMRPGLQRMEYMMQRLGNPERRLKFIHVAGTNGKGSTCAILSHVLHACGYGVGTFTSPYIEKFTNRIQFNGEDISEADCLHVVNQLKPLADELKETELGAPSMFELSTAIAILYFAKIACPYYVVWETGMGGRLDSTNIVQPLASVITNIGHDHMDILGDTLEAVAREKAGIIKSGVPVITTEERTECVNVLEHISHTQHTTLYKLHQHFHIEPVNMNAQESVFHFEGPFRRMEGLKLPLVGEHQLKNAAAALMTLEVLRQYQALICDEEGIRTGLQQVQWAGRMEKVSENPPIILDGAHNPEGAASLAQSIVQHYEYKKLHFMMGMLESKNHKGYLKHILPLVDTLIITEPDFPKKWPADQLLKQVRELKEYCKPSLEVIVEENWKSAVQELQRVTTDQDLGIVSGTLYLISDVRSWLLYSAQSEKGW